MKRLLFIMFCAMFSLAGIAQNVRIVKGAVMNENDEPLSGVTIKAVNSDAKTITDNNGRFELKVDLYIKYVEAIYENYITAKAEIDGSYIVFNLKLDKKLLKAKAEAESKRVVEQAKADKAKVEAEAKRVAEQAKADKAKAEAEAKRVAEQAKADKAKAEAEAKRVAEQAKADKAKAEAEAKRVAELAKAEAEVKHVTEQAIPKNRAKKVVLKANYSEHISGYNSIVDASAFFFRSVGINYIGGYKFNNYLFVGAGVGVEMPFGDNDIYLDDLEIKRGVSFPVYAHIRANFLNARWSPFFALSAGARFIIPQEVYIKGSRQSYEYNYISAFVNPQLGVNFKVTPKTSTYLSVGIDGYTEEELSIINDYQISGKPRFFLGFDLHLGVTF